VIEEIRHLNVLNKKYGDKVQVFYNGVQAAILENLGAEFRYEHIAFEDIIPVDILPIGNPVSLLADRNGIVHVIHRAEVGYLEKSRDFYDGVHSIFESIYYTVE